MPRFIWEGMKLGQAVILRVMVLLFPHRRPHGVPRDILLVGVGRAENGFFVEPLYHYLKTDGQPERRSPGGMLWLILLDRNDSSFI